MNSYAQRGPKVTLHDPDISVVILSFNSVNYLDKCLDSILSSTQSKNLIPEIYLIDNASTDGSIGILQRYKSQYPDIIKLKLFGENMGTTVSRNYGLSRVRGRYILLVDSDAYINGRALEHLIAELDASPDIGLVAPKILYPSGKFQKSTDSFPTVFSKAKRLFFLKSEEKREQLCFSDPPQEVDYAISAFWLLKKETLDEVGLLDERIFYSPEDVDYCIRIWKSGFRIIYDRRVEVIHDAQEISRTKLNYFFFSHIKGLFYLFGKHRYGIIKKSPLG
jgi:GT2 family glycosyltransferase